MCTRVYALGLLRDHVATMAREEALALAARQLLVRCGDRCSSLYYGAKQRRRTMHAMHMRVESRKRSDSKGAGGGNSWHDAGLNCHDISHCACCVCVCHSYSMQTRGERCKHSLVEFAQAARKQRVS